MPTPTITLYNTLTRAPEPLLPRSETVKVYCCGPTVYDVPHAGHARSTVAFDVLVRHLRSRGLDVLYVRNVTDIDDKILQRARENAEEPLALSRRMADVYQSDMRALGCVAPDHEPRVSEHIPEIIALVERLIAEGNAYAVDMPGGTRDVYFAVRSFDGYGKLSRRKIDDLRVGARVEADQTKRDPLDFALWKGESPEGWGWESPWGFGRPGWHIECSAMCTHYLGHGFDIHAGGMDLIFPHHENEIAQSEAAAKGRGPMARCWMHNGFVNVDKEKMSKSLGNFVTVRDVLARNDAEGFRWFLLTVHYRGPIQFETDQLESGRVVFPGVDEAERRVDYAYGTLERLERLIKLGVTVPTALPKDLLDLRKSASSAEEALEAAMDDDLNTPVALACLGEIVRVGNDLCDLQQKRKKDGGFAASASVVAADLRRRIRAASGRLGLLQVSEQDYRERTRARRLALRGLSAADVEAKVAARRDARAAKDFARGDALRDELLALGISLQDAPEGTTWTIDV